ncbi:MAG: hypothetical protein IH801_01985 [Nitrospinae bacterium]|nr:hypothetical protein [Nitrospinota bacterium]
MPPPQRHTTSFDKRSSRRRPPWLKVRMPGGPTYRRLQALMRRKRLHTRFRMKTFQAGYGVASSFPQP